MASFDVMIPIRGQIHGKRFTFASLIETLIFNILDRPGSGDYGVINGSGIGQSDLLWNVRSQQQIKHIFSRIWNTSQLFVSFDGCGIFRDWSQNPTWKTEGNWSHVDQNPKSKPNACCIQGLVAFTDQDETTGGLVVYPRSHLHFTDLCDVTDTPQDFVRIPKSYSIVNQCKTSGKLVHCRAGDFILWDSRTIHCNSPAVAIKERRKDEPIDLLRIVAYVSMSPISFVHGQTLDEFREKRKQMLENNCTLTHWSTELVLSGKILLLLFFNTLPKISFRWSQYRFAESIIR